MSCVGMGWAGNTYYAIDHWIETENDWNRFGPTFRTNHVIEISYERLISYPTEELKEVCEFIGVPFSPDMLRYPDASTYDAPDPSTIQRWKKTQTQEDIALAELKAKALLLQRRYELSGYPLDPPHSFKRFRLWLGNETYKWRFGLRRYGYINFLMEKVARKFDLPFHHVFYQRMNEIRKEHLK